MNNTERKIYITSDWHFCHNKPFLYEPRGFSSIQEMNEAIIKNFNEIVTPNDLTYCLGDCMLNNDNEGLNCIRRLNGEFILILGNHDTNNRIPRYLNELNWKFKNILMAERIKYKNYNIFLSHYPTLTANHDDGKSLKHKTINICGHSHVKDPFADWDKGCIFHAELDTNNNKPWLLDDIIKKIEEKVKND